MAVFLGTLITILIVNYDTFFGPVYKIEQFYKPIKEDIKKIGYEEYIIEDTAEIESFLKNENLLKYSGKVNAILDFSGLFTALEFKKVNDAKEFNENYYEVDRNQNIICYSNNMYLSELLYSKFGTSLSGEYMQTESGINILLRAKSNFITNMDVIGYRAFVDTDYKTVKLDSSVKRIDNQAFFNNTTTEEIVYSHENNIEYIGERAFENCINLNTINISSVKTINKFAFQNCEGLTTVELGEVESIGDGAFLGTKKLTTLTNLSGNYLIEDNIVYTKNKKNIIKSFSQETTISIPNEVETIEYGAFSNCLKLKNVTLRSNIKVLRDKAFANCISLASINLNNVISFGSESLLKTKITEINFSNNLKAIGSDVFRYTNLTSVNIPNSISEIGDRAFKDISSLRKVVFRSLNPFKIGEDVFDNVYRLYVNNESVFKDSWYEYNERIYSVNNIIGDFSYKEISGGLELVQYLGKNSDVVVPDVVNGKKVITLGDYSFYQLNQVKSVKFKGNNLVSVGNSAFDGCSSLEKVVLPYGLTTIGNNSFRSCNKLYEISAPTTLTKIGMHAFQTTKWFDNQGNFAILGNVLYKYKGSEEVVTIPNLKYISNRAFIENRKVKKIIVPEGILGIDDLAFYYCESLTEVILPTTLKTLATQVFVGCTSLRFLTLPKAVEYIGYGCFLNNHLETLTLLSDKPCTLGMDVFSYPQNSLFKIKVKSSALCDSNNGNCSHKDGFLNCYKHEPKWLAFNRNMEGY